MRQIQDSVQNPGDAPARQQDKAEEGEDPKENADLLPGGPAKGKTRKTGCSAAAGREQQDGQVPKL